MNTQPEPWPDELDALIAAPQHHKLLFENELARVLEASIPPGEMTAVHTHSFCGVAHRYQLVLILSGLMPKAMCCWIQGLW